MLNVKNLNSQSSWACCTLRLPLSCIKSRLALDLVICCGIRTGKTFGACCACCCTSFCIFTFSTFLVSAAIFIRALVPRRTWITELFPTSREVTRFTRQFNVFAVV